MKMVLRVFLVTSTLFLIIAAKASALTMQQEIQSLNQDFGHSQSYPIFILDKVDIRNFLSSNNLNAKSSQQDLVKALMIYVYQKFNYKAEPSDVFELLSYIVGQNTGASAMPFFVDTVHHEMKYCVVLPSDALADHAAEVKRILGADGQEEIFKDLNLEEVGRLLTTEEIQLFSLYHETSHCLDQKYLPQMYESSETDPYAVHKAEAFAEINALFLLNQRKGLNQLGYPRSLIRTAYSKFYGPFLAQSDSPWTNPVVKWGGSTYFLAAPLLKAQNAISADSQKMAAMSLAETISASQNIIDTTVMSKYGFEALQMNFSNGRTETLAHYEMLATKAPRIFGTSYQELQDALVLLDSVQEKISTYQKQ
jgi:hypothetical protein